VSRPLDPAAVRADFPILATRPRGNELVYLDNGATTQKPKSVIQAVSHYYETLNANVHRGAYWLSQEATEQYEKTRNKVCDLLGTSDTREVIYTRGTTESINLVAQCWGRQNIHPGDAIVVTRMEHHSNFVPWQMLAKERGAEFRIVELDAEGRIDLNALEQALTGKPKLVALTHVSNVLGTLNPVKKISEMAHAAGAKILIDAAQSIAHFPIRMSDLGPVDFLAFSSHKMCGPTGFGILWARRELLEAMTPWQYGGDMILQVTDQNTTWNDLPWKFEAGTPNIAGAIGLGAAIDYLIETGLDRIHDYETTLTQKALKKLSELDFVRLVGPTVPRDRGPVFSMVLEGVHPHDIATILDDKGIAVRAGHHCAQPLIDKLGVPATVRASFSFYNTENEIDKLCEGLRGVKRYFG